MHDTPRIFISYRRSDSAGYARAIGDELGRHWGADRVFIDVDDIAGGQPFADVIERAVGACRVLVVLIGPRWLGETIETGDAAGGTSRLDDPQDFVRREVVAALQGGMAVVPVLLDGASMPPATALPDAMRALAGRQAVELRHSRFADDMTQLVEVLRRTVGEPPAATPGPGRADPRRRRLIAVAVGLAAAVAVAAVVVAFRPGTGDGRAAINGRWTAEVVYDWPGARYDEVFEFDGDGDRVHGSASFLGVRRGFADGTVDAAGLHFVTRTRETLGAGDQSREVSHDYRARLVDGELRFVMVTEGGWSSHVPIEFTARRASAPGR